MTQDTRGPGRRVVANFSLSLDGRINGPGGEYDMGWIGRHAISDAVREFSAKLSQATTILLGRKNYVGFGGFWPAVAKDETADPRDRAMAQWLDSAEKIVFSTTLTEATWNNSRLADGTPVEVVKALRARPGGDIVIQNSMSIIKTLLQAGEVDRLSIVLCPEIAGGGDRLFEDGLPASSWSLTDVSTSDTGAMGLFYDKVRD